MRILIPLHIFFLAILNSNAQDSTSVKSNIFSAGLGVQQGFIFAHTQSVLNTKGSYPFGVEGILSWQRNDAAVWELCNCFPRKGLLLAYYDYDSRILGRSYTTAYFLEPTYRLGKKVFFSFRAAAGLSWLSNPYDSISNPSNQSYSTNISVYLLFGLGAWFRLNDHWWLNASVNYQHDSNGGSKEPNKGINWPTAGFTVSYQRKSRPYYTGGSRAKFQPDHSLRFDLGLFGALTRSLDASGNSSQWPLIGISLQSAKQIGRLSGITAGAEVYRDESLDIKLKRFSVDASPVKAGILLGHEFILGRFLFSQRLGVYIFDQTPYYDMLYHRWGIFYRVNQHIGLGLNLQAHRHVADFADLRMCYTFQNK